MSNIVGTREIDRAIAANKIQSTQVGLEDTPGYPHSKLHAFLKRNVQSLGVAQIMIGLKCFLFGIIWSVFPLSSKFRKIFSCFYTGYPLWAATSFIISGSLTILSTKKRTKCLVGLNIGANIISTVLSSIGIILLSLNLVDIFFFDCAKVHGCLFTKSFRTSIVILQMMLTSVQLSISFSLSGLTYNVNGDSISWVSALRCLVKANSEDPYQDLLTTPAIYEELELQDIKFC
ncbi:high affinity immunoglobulin epsilon receptor subunit beta-like [Tamandua tetradactyla]|uniref:high affinity immunoglobulin epsilon receptor subunit beta-like n=1 Tax=Tamandua tetradactyla TaxID=48850 RepID=UPI0040548A07